MKRFLCVNNLCVALLVTLGACTGSSPVSGPPIGPHDLTIVGDASFHGSHGDQSISIALVGFDEILLGQTSTTVSSSEEPSFSFTFRGVLRNGLSYQVHYWIDSNDGGGSEGTCDPPVIDPQWSGASFRPLMDVAFIVVHDDANNSEVCSKFEF